MLSLVRSMKNKFAPINRVPLDIFYLIPGYWDGGDVDENLITLTHVCRSWRELLIAHSSLWTHMDCKNTNKTRIYIERSKSSPLKISLYAYGVAAYPEEAFLFVAPHISRLRSLSIDGTVDPLRNLTPHLSCPVPLLRELTINLTCDPEPTLESTLFNGDLSSLYSLSLAGVITNLPWKNMSKLTTFTLSHVPDGGISITQLLDFFTNTCHLRDITLDQSIPTSSNALPGRVVPLPYLKNLIIYTDRVPTLLNHLSIPVGASLTLDFGFHGDKSPLPELLPKPPTNLKNITSITSVNLCLGAIDKYVRLDGPSGRLYILGHWDWDETTAAYLDYRIVRSLNYFALSGTRRLAVTDSHLPMATKFTRAPAYYILHHMKHLRTLTLAQCHNLPFFLALNPDLNPSKVILCPNLEKLILYVETQNSFGLPELLSMVKERASVGTKLPSLRIIGLGGFVPGVEALKLEEHISHLDFESRREPPNWDTI